MTFRHQVEELVGQIPSGRVMNYGQLAALAGRPRAARQVGGLAHFGNPSLPWHRVVFADGRLAAGYPGGRQNQYHLLKKEGIKFHSQQSGDWRLNCEQYRFWPVGFEQPNVKS